MDFGRYDVPTPHVTRVDGGWLEVFMADDVPRVGEVLEFVVPEAHGPVYAEVRRLAGARLVQAEILNPPAWLKPGVRARRPRRRAGFRTPFPALLDPAREGIVPLSEASEGELVPLDWTPPRFMELDGARPALPTGLERLKGLDMLCPLARGGMNLVITGAGNAPGLTAARLAQIVAHAGTFDAVVLAGPPSMLDALTGAPFDEAWRIAQGPQSRHQVAALRMGAASVAHLRRKSHDAPTHVLFVGLLPWSASPDPTPAPGRTLSPAPALPLADVVDILGSALASTHATRVTTVVELCTSRLDEGFETIAETLDLGTVDVQLVLDGEGRLDPRRSLSRATLGPEAEQARAQALAALTLAAQAIEMAGIFGSDELTPAQAKALEVVEGLRVRVV